jgi:penicillin-binding protein 1A
VAGAWIGFDEKVTLGDKETGGRAALPMWLEFMREVYKDKPVQNFEAARTKAVTAAPEVVTLPIQQAQEHAR